jgi:(1->4)-alpha-D-glucan 1-alpha-D-glucosylmutase
VALRMEDEAVFHATHRTVFEWIQNGYVTGLRIDHPDGLRDPQEYFERLQKSFASVHGSSAWLYVVAEKILSPGEPLPQAWAVAGTTGYEFLNLLNGIFVAEENERAITDIYREFTGLTHDFAEVAYASKKHVLETLFVAEIDALTNAARRISQSKDEPGPFVREQLRTGIIELAAGFPTYRTYLREKKSVVSEHDKEALSQALSNALTKAPLAGAAIRFIASLFTLPADTPASRRSAAMEFVLKFQQLTGPAAAKGVEDTAFYRYCRLISLNEVGGDPGKFGITVKQFHRENGNRARCWPHSMLTTSTHDTKRGEDARARINVLSEMPEEWRAALSRWSLLNERHKTIAGGRSWPDGNDEYLVYQTLVGAWPAGLMERAKANTAVPGVNTVVLVAFRERISAYMRKAIREAKRHTSWTDPNEAYETAMMCFVEGLLGIGNLRFMEDFAAFHKAAGFFGAINSLSQTVLKLASSGVPDTYQGSESWNFSLVDPDNRQPIDFDQLQKQLRALMTRGSVELPVLDEFTQLPFNAKLFVYWKTLELRRRLRELFAHGDYISLESYGVKARHVCAFARTFENNNAIVICPRLPFELLGKTISAPCGRAIWGNTWLDASLTGGKSWHNQFTGERVSIVSGRLEVADALARFPVALLHST